MKIVNIHIPKCGGTSFRKSLEQYDKNIIYDYGNKISRDLKELVYEFTNFNNNIILDDYIKINCISGHILPIKYKKLYDNGWKFITWLREPSQMLYSKYYHLTKESNVHSFGKYILDNKIPVEDFVFLPEIKNFYQKFFYNFHSKNYFFIGIVENYESDLKKLSQLLSLELKNYTENVNKDKQTNYYDIEPKLLGKIKEYHKNDYDLYETFKKI